MIVNVTFQIKLNIISSCFELISLSQTINFYLQLFLH